MKTAQYSKTQLTFLILLRVLIGWYFLYEGIAKVFSPNWSAYGYLMDSKGLFAPFFTMIAENQTLLAITNYLNIYGLILIGLSLILGCFANIGQIAAIILLALYYLSHPPLINVTYILPAEGTYLWVDKNLIIMAAILVLMAFPTSKVIGLDRLFKKKKQ
jgi:thiosulfate dehydrogenase [quinone] large subunit